ncbi:hypothetical protein NIES4074_65910 [Cylindrospermum sp. NIES-4074]|nr:hypothetical protein NIES4074_65910 [Cylindrospermum sp. NIES-4074]
MGRRKSFPTLVFVLTQISQNQERKSLNDSRDWGKAVLTTSASLSHATLY